MPAFPMAVIYQGEPPQVGIEALPYRGSEKTYHAKFRSWQQSPFDQTLFLDNDTLVLRDCQPVFPQDDVVVALPYPDSFSTEPLGPVNPLLELTEWTNINAGVVCFPQNFPEACSELFDRFGHRLHDFPAKDQYLISYYLNCHPEIFQPSDDIQVTTTPHAVDHLIEKKAARSPVKLGIVPLDLLLDAYVFHYTQNKQVYEEALFGNLNP